MFGRSLKLPFRLLGIPVQLDVSFLFVLPLLAWPIGRQTAAFASLFGIPDAPVLHQTWMPYVIGLICAVGLFASVVIPAITLDGGRVLRSVVALWMPRERATAIAAALSRTLAVLMGILGLVSLNFFLLLIAIFIYIAVNVEAGTTEMERLLRGFTVADV